MMYATYLDEANAPPFTRTRTLPNSDPQPYTQALHEILLPLKLDFAGVTRPLESTGM